MMDWLAEVDAALRRGERRVLVSVIDPGSSNLPLAGHWLLHDDGTLDGPALAGEQAAALHRLGAQLGSEGGAVVTGELGAGLVVCCELLQESPRLIVCGAGHIALALAPIARLLGFSVTVIDDRPDFASAERFPECTVIADDFPQALARCSYGPSTYVVVITRGHSHDGECLTQVLPRPTAYVGLIGSRRRIQFVRQGLIEQGSPAARVLEMFTPIGVPIGAESPEEIALAIAAELVCVRRLGAAGARALRGEGALGTSPAGEVAP